jgi:hypothetical protein
MSRVDRPTRKPDNFDSARTPLTHIPKPECSNLPNFGVSFQRDYFVLQLLFLCDSPAKSVALRAGSLRSHDVPTTLPAPGDRMVSSHNSLGPSERAIDFARRFLF